MTYIHKAMAVVFCDSGITCVYTDLARVKKTIQSLTASAVKVVDVQLQRNKNIKKRVDTFYSIVGFL